MTNSANTRIGVGIVGASADRGWGGIAHAPGAAGARCVPDPRCRRRLVSEGANAAPLAD